MEKVSKYLPTQQPSSLARSVDTAPQPSSEAGDSQKYPIPREHEMMEIKRISGSIDQDSNSRKSCHDFCKDPFPICCDACFASIVEIDAVEARDCESHNELKESKSTARDCAGKTAVAGGDGGEHLGVFVEFSSKGGVVVVVAVARLGSLVVAGFWR